jgi:U4/U6.U5 tri-snRNP-associated protein 3
MEYNTRNRQKRPRSRSRSRSRSPSPPHRGHDHGHNRDRGHDRDRAMDQREKLDMERKARMARLRAENDEEEKKLAAVDQAAKFRGEGREYEISDMGNGNHKAGKSNNVVGAIEVNEEELEGLDEEEQMQKLFGFGGFASTKGKAVEDNQSSASKGLAAKNKARKYRQYMNRKGGFNRPLDKMK